MIPNTSIYIYIVQYVCGYVRSGVIGIRDDDGGRRNGNAAEVMDETVELRSRFCSSSSRQVIRKVCRVEEGGNHSRNGFCCSLRRVIHGALHFHAQSCRKY